MNKMYVATNVFSVVSFMKIFSNLVAFRSRVIMWEVYLHIFFPTSVFCHDSE